MSVWPVASQRDHRRPALADKASITRARVPASGAPSIFASKEIAILAAAIDGAARRSGESGPIVTGMNAAGDVTLTWPRWFGW